MPSTPTLTALALAALAAAAAPALAQDRGIPGWDLPAEATMPGAPGTPGLPLVGWSTLGPVPPEAAVLPGARPALRLRGNTTLLTPQLTVPPGAQTLAIRARSVVGMTLAVGAQAPGVAAATPLGVVAPTAAGGVVHVNVAGVAGASARLVLDPTGPFGASMEVGEVGPFAAPLPGWRVTEGAPAVSRRVAVVGDGGRLRAEGPPVTAPADARRLLVAFRGPGRVRLDAGAGARSVGLTARWRDVSVPVVPGGPVRPLVEATATGDSLALRDLGLWVRAVPLRVISAGRSGRRVAVTGTLGPAGAGLRLRLRIGARDRARTRARADGAFRLRATLPRRPRATGRAVVLLDRTRTTLGVGTRVRQLETKRG